MTNFFRPFPVHKPSDVEWFGDVPAHWDVLSLRNLLAGTNERNRPDLPLLSVVRERGVILRNVDDVEENHNFIPDDLSNYRVVKSGQFAMNKMKAWQGSYGVSKYDGIVSPAYFVFDLDLVGRDFFHAAIRSKAYVPFFTQASDGVRIGQWDLSKPRMREIPFLVPPLSEQRAIVRYLDYVDRRIHRYIDAKRKLIDLLEEEKEAIINQAVTRGLDPNVRLKSSAVEWLGDVPEHWEVVQLGRVIDLTTGFPFKSQDFSLAPNDIRLVRGINVAPGHLRWKDVVRWPKADSGAYGDYRMESGDIVLGMDRPFIEAGVRVASVTEDDLPALLLQRVARIRPHQELCSAFALLLLTGRSFVDYLEPLFTGISVPHISPEQVKSYRVPLPNLREQILIVDHLNKATTAIDSAVARARRQIELLQEYRTRLISDVVTGKLDVREAAQLPGEDDEGNEPIIERSNPSPGVVGASPHDPAKLSLAEA